MDILTKRQGGIENRQEPATMLQVHLLSQSVRAAGQFQRSALGHMDHEHWLARLRTDGQQLIDLLTKMGFTATDDHEAQRPLARRQRMKSV